MVELAREVLTFQEGELGAPLRELAQLVIDEYERGCQAEDRHIEQSLGEAADMPPSVFEPEWLKAARRAADE